MQFLALDHLRKSYGDHVAVAGLDLEVERGEFVALLGPSGCGKTTTLQMIAGFVEPSSGAIRLEGRDLLGIKANARGLGVVFQSYALFPHMTVAENVAFGLQMRRIPTRERGERVVGALALVGLGLYAHRFPRQLSGGQQQRVALARALVIKPAMLLLDEPLSNLDAKLREEMQTELRDIQRTVGTTTILVTHDQGEAMALADRIVVMNAGRIEQVGQAHEVYERPATPFVASFLGKTNVFAGARVALEGGGRTLRLGDWVQTLVQPAPEGPVTITVRPEKIALADGGASDGLPGTVRARVFQGTTWLLRVETPSGLVTVIRPNVGEPAPGEGQAVRLHWRQADAMLRPADIAS